MSTKIYSRCGGYSEASRAITPAMADILKQLATGFTAKEIADKRGSSVKTVEAIIAAAKSRLGAKTTTQAVVMWAMREDEE